MPGMLKSLRKRRLRLEPVLVERVEAVDPAVAMDEPAQRTSQLVVVAQIIDAVVVGQRIAQLGAQRSQCWYRRCRAGWRRPHAGRRRSETSSAESAATGKRRSSGRARLASPAADGEPARYSATPSRRMYRWSRCNIVRQGFSGGSIERWVSCPTSCSSCCPAWRSRCGRVARQIDLHKWDKVDSGISMSAFDFARYLLNRTASTRSASSRRPAT